MKSSIDEIIPIIGAAMGGGFYAGRIRISEQVFALIVAPKDRGETKAIWINDYKPVPGALSYDDGLANTQAMVEAGSALAIWTRSLAIADHTDWYLPAQDELEILYRNLKPTTRENYCWARSGINLSAVVPTRPYTPAHPLQTPADAFQADGDQAFENGLYWSSTQHAAGSDFAWCQYFGDGYQYDDSTNNKLRARAVRRLPI